MSDSIEKKILKNIEDTLTALKTAGTLGTVKFGTFEPSNQTLPVAGFVPHDDTGEHNSGVLRHGMDIVISLVAGEAGDVQAGYIAVDLAAIIEAKMVEDVHRGGNARDTRYVSKHWLFNDKDYPMAGVDITYHIDFATKITDPTAQP